MILCLASSKRNHEPTSPSRTTTDRRGNVRGKKWSKSEALWKTSDRRSYSLLHVRRQVTSIQWGRVHQPVYRHYSQYLKESNKNEMSANRKQKKSKAIHYLPFYGSQRRESETQRNRDQQTPTLEFSIKNKIHVSLPRSTREMLVVV